MTWGTLPPLAARVASADEPKRKTAQSRMAKEYSMARFLKCRFLEGDRFSNLSSCVDLASRSSRKRPMAERSF